MKNIIFTSLMLLLAFAQTQAQRLAHLKKGNELYNAKQYTEAIAEYESLMNSSTGKKLMGVDARINLADCYRMTANARKAEELYREVLGEGKDRPDIYLNFGEVLMGVGKLDEAKAQFTQYAIARPEDPKGAQLATRCDQIQAIRPLYSEVNTEIQTAVNTPKSDEFGMAYFGSGLVFSSDQIAAGMTIDAWKGKAYLNMYYSEIGADGNLSAPRLFSKKLNSMTRHDGPATFSRDNKTIYYSQSVKPKANAAADATLALQIVMAQNAEGKWGKTEVLPFIIPDMIYSHPCLSADGTQLFFMSNATGGQGGTDIWVSTYKYGRWTNPRNLGTNINTSENEAFPFIHPDGTLYFASKGHGNYGGYDLFRALPVGNGLDWQKAENIGKPFNSAFDDTYFLLSDDQTHGFFASDREGTDDIYRFTLVGAEAKALPEGIKSRSAAIFSDSSDVEALVIENTNDEPVKKDDGSDEKFVDEMLQKANANKANKTDNSNTNPNPTDKTPTDNNPTDNKTDKTDNKTDIGANDNKTDKTDNKTDKTDNKTDKTNKKEPAIKFVEKTDKTNNNDNNLTSDNNTNTLNNDNSSKNSTLTLDLKIVDVATNGGLKDATVTLKNNTSGDEKTYKVSSTGSVQLYLQANQNYSILASSPSYYNGQMPVTTKEIKEPQQVAASLPLYKKK